MNTDGRSGREDKALATPTLHLCFQDREGVGLHAPRVNKDNMYQRRHPNQRRTEAGPGRGRPRGCRYVAHHQIQDESRRSHRSKEGCMYADLSMVFAGSVTDEKDCSLETRHVCDVRWALEPACAGDHPCPHCFCAVRQDSTHGSPVRRCS